MAVRPKDTGLLLDPEQLHLLESLVNQVALAIERTRLSEEAQQAHVRAETERMRNAILSSVSHDLRTPLATITGAASSLVDERSLLNPTIASSSLDPFIARRTAWIGCSRTFSI